jgi:hypothetical protein
MNWIKRYRFTIFLYLGFFITEFLLLPSQERFYLQEDLWTITRIGWRITLITAGTLYVLLLILMIVKKALGWGIVNALFFVAGIALFFHPAFETATLFLNRQFNGAPYQRRFVVSAMAGDTANKNKFLYDLQLGHSIYSSDQDRLLPAAHLDPRLRGDTVTIPFYRGLFGVSWFQTR